MGIGFEAVATLRCLPGGAAAPAQVKDGYRTDQAHWRGRATYSLQASGSSDTVRAHNLTRSFANHGVEWRCASSGKYPPPRMATSF